MRVGVWMVRGVVGGNNSVPDDGFGGRGGVWGFGVWIGGGDPEEDLLGVPVEEGGEVGVEGEGDVGVFFTLGGVVVRAALGAVVFNVSDLMV